MTYLYGTRVRDVNLRLRMFVLLFFGMAALASVIYWRAKTILAAEYVDFPIHKHLTTNPNE